MPPKKTARMTASTTAFIQLLRREQRVDEVRQHGEGEHEPDHVLGAHEPASSSTVESGRKMSAQPRTIKTATAKNATVRARKTTSRMPLV